MNSLMKVATLLFDTTVHSYSLMSSTSAGTFYVEVVLHLHLAGQTPVVLDFLAGEMHGLGGEDFASAFGYTHLALAAAAFAAAG